MTLATRLEKLVGPLWVSPTKRNKNTLNDLPVVDLESTHTER